MRLHTNCSKRRRGITLVEVIVSTMLVGLVLVGAMNGVGSVLKTWRAGEQRHDGLNLCQQLMMEILQQRYEEPDDPVQFGRESSESGGDRGLWDDIDDYHGWSSAPEDASGNPLAGYGNWTRSVTVELAQLADPTQTAVSDEGLKRITVTVTDPSGQTTVLNAYRSKWGVLEEAPDAAATLQTMVTDELEVGGLSLHGGVQVQNHAQDE